ncbi:unnamed protein product [Paramecium pentaurelia]|uniref:Uncharacterized protein n=1 Tax=Paramecium pentaurelia TaxID=43138 RepID=A0A8S1WRB8_9CILI|nr:unnamed protein product [Paramecium pentaurelia]
MINIMNRAYGVRNAYKQRQMSQTRVKNRKIIKQTLLELHFYLKQKLKYIDEFLMIIKIQFQILEQSIKDTEKRINLWKDQLIKVRDDQCTYSLIQEHSNLDKEENQWGQEKQLISQNQINYYQLLMKSNSKFRTLQNHTSNFILISKSLYLINQYKLEQMQLQKENLSQNEGFYNKLFNKLVQEIRQNEICYAIGLIKMILQWPLDIINVQRYGRQKMKNYLIHKLIYQGNQKWILLFSQLLVKEKISLFMKFMIVVQEYGLRL